jgi:hypothetical protein
VVNCVVNADSGWSLFGGLKFGDFSDFIFCPIFYFIFACP